MKRTIYLPDDLARHVEAYLARHRGITLSTLVQEALEERVGPADPREILRLAGLVPKASTSARRRAEDRHISRAR
jgi:hypothetical protein